MIDLLQVHDFVFIQRSCGRRYTYAQIVNRSEDSIEFVVDVHGSTKTLSRKHWSSSIRLVNSKYNRAKSVTLDHQATTPINSQSVTTTTTNDKKYATVRRATVPIVPILKKESEAKYSQQHQKQQVVPSFAVDRLVVDIMAAREKKARQSISDDTVLSLFD